MKNNEKKTCKVERRILLDAFFYNALLATFLLDECTATLSLLGFVNSSSMAFGQKGEGQSVFELPGTIFFDGKSYTVTSIESIFGLKMDKIIIPGSVKHVEERAFLSEAGRLRQIEVSDEALLNYVMIPEGVEVVTETFQIEDLRDLPDYRLTSNKDGHVLEFKMKPHMSVVGCRKMEDVAYLTIPSVVSGISVTEIGEGAFQDCVMLESVKLPRMLETIGDSAFFGCNNLASVSFPKTLRKLGGDSFFGTDIESVFIPEDLRTIEGAPFGFCERLTSIKVAKGNLFYNSGDDCNAIIETATDKLIQGCVTTVIPDTVKAIGEEAFWGCVGLKRVVIPDSVTEIGKDAFFECDDLEEIVIQDASLLKDAGVPEGVKIFDKKGIILGIVQSLLDHIGKNSKKEVKA